MPSNTSRLNLYKTNPSTDGEMTFNIQTMLNDNWDKIDTNVAKLTDIPTIPTSLPANGGNSTTVNNHTAAATPQTTEQNDLIGMVNEVNNNLSSHLADDTKHIDYAVASGTNTYTATIANITALTEGLSIKIKFTNANTGASTLNINNLGAKTIQKGNGNALSSGNIKAGQICHLVYTGSVFQLLGEGGEYGTASPSEVLNGYTIGTESGVLAGLLALTANATAADVVSGKTFYNTDAKTKVTGSATITSLGGKRFATGTTTASTTGACTVTGLSFRPAYIICWLTGTTISNRMMSCIMTDTDNTLEYNSGTGGRVLRVQNFSTQNSGNPMVFLETTNYITNDGFSNINLISPNMGIVLNIKYIAIG